MSDCNEPDIFDPEWLDLSPEELQKALEWGSACWHADPTVDPTDVAAALGLIGGGADPDLMAMQSWDAHERACEDEAD